MSAFSIPIHPGHVDTRHTTLNLSGYVQVQRHPVESVVAEQWGVDPQLLHTHDRHHSVVMARRVAMVLLVECGMVPEAAASHFSQDRSMYSWNKLNTEEQEATDPVFRSKIHAARAALGL